MAAADSTCFGIASYNLRGINNGRSGLLELCDNADIHVIAIQEHWLNDANLQWLNTIHPDFVGFSISSMSDRLRTAVYYGRPYGGVGFLWRKTISNKVKICAKAASGRCLCITVSLDSGTEVNLTNVYFPCYSSSIGYSNELSECLSFIEEVLDNNNNNNNNNRFV